MEANKILSADVLDIIFDGKNKDYGAYELRKTYNRRITRALVITGSVALLALLTSILSSTLKLPTRVALFIPVEAIKLKTSKSLS